MKKMIVVLKSLVIVLLCFVSVTCANLANDKAPEKKLKVAILVYEGVYLLDFAGPLEVFSDAMANDTTPAFEVFLVSPKKEKLRTHTNTEITPDYALSDCPQPDLLVVPGGNLRLASQDSSVAQWISKASAKARIVMSVCTGAFILADLGMLDGLEATTWFGACQRLQKKHPKVKVITDTKFTDNGKIITTAGISAGIDGSLHVVGKLLGGELQKRTAEFIEWK